ncbi:hypothetical protein LXL04_023471 [Taraxacum kok-saghyz]
MVSSLTNAKTTWLDLQSKLLPNKLKQSNVCVVGEYSPNEPKPDANSSSANQSVEDGKTDIGHVKVLQVIQVLSCQRLNCEDKFGHKLPSQRNHAVLDIRWCCLPVDYDRTGMELRIRLEWDMGNRIASKLKRSLGCEPAHSFLFRKTRRIRTNMRRCR